METRPVVGAAIAPRSQSEQAEYAEYREHFPLPAEEAAWFARHVRAGHLTVEDALNCMKTPTEIERAVEELAGQDPEGAAILGLALGSEPSSMRFPRPSRSPRQCPSRPERQIVGRVIQSLYM